MTTKPLAGHNQQKKIALINDLTGFGRCSITVQLPIISTLGIECCPVPTSIFSNHTAYPSYHFHDYTDELPDYLHQWELLGLRFEGIATGFLGSARQISIVNDFIQRFRSADSIIIIDPVMGDNGKPYATYTSEMCENMTRLVQSADIVTPNVTEACILTNTPYQEKWTKRELLSLAQQVSALGPRKVVITGIPQKTYVSNLCYEQLSDNTVSCQLLRTHRVGDSRCGTGDVFSSIIAADAVNGVEFTASVRKASRFIKRCILRSMELGIPLEDGVCFEELLHTLH